MNRPRTLALFVLCAAFVAYLSFIPFRFQPLALDEAVARFLAIRYLDLGAGSRADWVANILMFLPLGWLAAAFFAPHPRGRFDLAAIVPSFLLGAACAVAIEFGQVFFPGRTVSINDIVAEFIGTLVGAWLWSAFGTHGRDWWRALARGGPATANAALGAYVLAYLVLSFSPFDFVISAAELAQKAASNLSGWWLAPVSCGPTPCSVKLLSELLAVSPFGWWLAARRRDGRGAIVAAAAVGFSLGLLIELMQFLLVSGTSQGASVFARTAGMAFGAWSYAQRPHIAGFDWARRGRAFVAAALLPYLAAVGYVSGWFGGPWLGLEEGLARIDRVVWLPFYYQYFSTEQALIRSTLVHLALYAPVGVGVWLWAGGNGRGSAPVAAALAAALAFVAESGKVFVGGKHPDYTDTLFAAIAAWTAATILRWASGASRHDAGAPLESAAAAARANSFDVRPTVAGAVSRGRSLATAAIVGRFAGAAVLAIVIASLARFPVGQIALAIGLAAYASLLAFRPSAYLLVVPAALPLFDLAPLSGRFFWDEFDLLLATTLGVRLLMSSGSAMTRIAGSWPIGLLALSVLASAAIAIWPLAPFDANAFTSYLSGYNPLRVAKGYAWAGVLLVLVHRDARQEPTAVTSLPLGLALGLVAAAGGVLVERLLFAGEVGLSDPFRAAGFVSATHVGGAYLEAILVMLTPFALWLAFNAKRSAYGVLWSIAVLLGALAVLSTLSRAAAVAWAVAVASFAVLWLLAARRAAGTSSRLRWAFALGVGVVCAAGLFAWTPQSADLRARLSASDSDFGRRVAHWETVVDLWRFGPVQSIAGMGLGTFPREFYLAHAIDWQLPAYSIDHDSASGRSYLALTGGRSLYVDQRVAAVRGRPLRLQGLVRSAGSDGAGIHVGLCEKSLLTSVDCAWTQVAADGDWRSFEAELMLGKAAGRGLLPPISLSLHNGRFGTRVEVTALSLRDGPRELLRNGAFESGLDRWFMSSDLHLAWRAHNTWLQVAFEQGLLGVLAWLAVGLSVTLTIVRAERTSAAVASAPALLGFLGVGLFDSLLDWPRLVVLLGLVVAVARYAAPAGPGTRSR